MAVKGYSILPKFPELKPHHQMQFETRWGRRVLPLCGGDIGVSWFPSRQGDCVRRVTYDSNFIVCIGTTSTNVLFFDGFLSTHRKKQANSFHSAPFPALSSWNFSSCYENLSLLAMRKKHRQINWPQEAGGRTWSLKTRVYTVVNRRGMFILKITSMLGWDAARSPQI